MTRYRLRVPIGTIPSGDVGELIVSGMGLYGFGKNDGAYKMTIMEDVINEAKDLFEQIKDINYSEEDMRKCFEAARKVQGNEHKQLYHFPQDQLNHPTFEDYLKSLNK